MRSLCVAAYLRCLFAAIEYAPDQAHKNEAIRYLKDEFASGASPSCATPLAGSSVISGRSTWSDEHIIKVPFSSPVEHIDHMQHYEILVSSPQEANGLAIRQDPERKVLHCIGASLWVKTGRRAIALKADWQRTHNEDKVLTTTVSHMLAPMFPVLSLQMVDDECWSRQASTLDRGGLPRRSASTPDIFSLPSQSILTFIDIVSETWTTPTRYSTVKIGRAWGGRLIKLKNNMARSTSSSSWVSIWASARTTSMTSWSHSWRGCVR